MEATISYQVNQMKGGAMSADMFIKDVQKWLGVSRSTVLYWINQGWLPNARQKNPYAQKSAYVIPEEDIINYLNKNDLPIPPLPKAKNGNA